MLTALRNGAVNLLNDRRIDFAVTYYLKAGTKKGAHV